MTRLTLIAATGLCLGLISPAGAASRKERDCAYQAAVMSSVQNARLSGVRANKVTETLLANTPPWPERYNASIPQLTEFVYAQKKRDLKKADLGVFWNEQCLANYDQIKQMQKKLNN